MVVHLKEGRHSPRGASGYSRWSVCGGSVELSDGISSPGSEYAAGGTAAHWVMEQCLENNQDAWEFVGTEFKVDKTKVAEDGTAPEWWSITADVEMVDAVQVFLDTIRGDIDEYMADPRLSQMDGEPIMWVEQGLSLEPLGQPDMFGKADCIVYFPAWNELRVYDYKHGAGVLVEVVNNGQLRYYAVGAVLATHEGIGARPGIAGAPVERVQSVVVQPRADHRDGPVRRESLTIDELNAWSEFELIPAADRTREVDAPLVAGDHCRWCPAKDICPKRNATGVDMLAAGDTYEVSTPVAGYTDDHLARQLNKISIAEDFIKTLKAEAFKRLEAGKMKDLGWGLAHKKANRQWKVGAEEAAEAEFGDKAYEPPKDPTIRSPAQLSKLKGGPEFSSEWAFTPDTGLTLARTDGKRKTIEVEDRDAAMREALDKAE